MISNDVINNLLDTARTVSYIPTDAIKVACLIVIIISLCACLYLIWKDETQKQ